MQQSSTAYDIESLIRDYRDKKHLIKKRLLEFKDVWLKSDNRALFSELAFCLLTPQSKATVCWQAILRLKYNNALFTRDAAYISGKLKGVRFKYRKAAYIVEARRKLLGDLREKLSMELRQGVAPLRKWLVDNVKGMGYKEASHFLRNIGFGDELAILDRHILKNLVILGVIEKVPDTLSTSMYINIEHKMREFSNSAGIPMPFLDLLLWQKETGEIFK